MEDKDIKDFSLDHIDIVVDRCKDEKELLLKMVL